MIVMGFHSFSLDPRTMLGVGPNASLEEIHDAYRAKSKKHHPDRGGDEWAFRMVARAYEVLRTTAASVAAQPWEPPRGGTGRGGPRPIGRLVVELGLAVRSAGCGAGPRTARRRRPAGARRTRTGTRACR